LPSTENLTLVKLLKALMANRVGSEHQSPSRAPIRLAGSVLLLGTLLAWWGTRDHRRLFGDLPRRPVAAAVLSIPPNIQIEGAAVARGLEIEHRQCAGCHEMATRSSAPSYQEIVAFYLHRSADRNEKSDLLTRLSSAVGHPQPGWGNFAPGPAESDLSPEDRVAVASWILSNFEPEKSATKGVAKWQP
jgi:cytochrome c551/c552